MLARRAETPRFVFLSCDQKVERPLGGTLDDGITGHAIDGAEGQRGQTVGMHVAAETPVDRLTRDEPLQSALDILRIDAAMFRGLVRMAGTQQRQQRETRPANVIGTFCWFRASAPA